MARDEGVTGEAGGKRKGAEGPCQPGGEAGTGGRNKKGRGAMSAGDKGPRGRRANIGRREGTPPARRGARSWGGWGG